MSGIAGVLHFDGSPVDPALLKRMTDALAHRGPDDAGYWTEGPAGMGHRQFWTTPEALHERQPHHDAEAKLCLTFDGRLDNREELATAIRGKGVALRDDTDAELVLRAYEAWGEESPKRLLGDFAYAIWDGTKRRLFCARDYMGVRPFHYHHAGAFLLFASELHALFRDPRLQVIPDEGMIAEYLSVHVASHTDTLFKGVVRLPMAHCLSVDASGRSRTWRYWDPDFGRRSPCRTDAEFAEAFLEVVRAGVRCRLRAHGPVGAELSGGLDSSTVSVIANDLLVRHGTASAPLHTYSIVYPNLPCDESHRIKATIERGNLKGRLLENIPLPPGYFAAVVAKYREFPGYPNADQGLHTVADAASRDGCRVVLTGQGGNEWLEGNLDHVADLLRDGNWGDAWQLSSEGAACFKSSAARLFYRHGLRPWIRRAIPVPGRGPSVLPWIVGDFRSRTDLRARLRCATKAPSSASFMQAHMYRVAFSGLQAQSYEALERVTTGFGMDYRHPLLDRRVAEFCLSLPGEQRWRRGKPKTVLRNAMATRLPAEVVENDRQADFTILYLNAMDAAIAAAPFRKWSAGSMRWVDVQELARRYNSARASVGSDGFTALDGMALCGSWAAYGMGIWAESHPSIRSREG